MERRDALKAMVLAILVGSTPKARGEHRAELVYHPAHTCPRCGRTQLVVHSFGPGPYHSHACPSGSGTMWFH